MPLYFAYGSNMSSARLRGRLGDVHIVGRAALPDYRHFFDKHGADGTAKGNIVAETGATVLGVLYRIEATQLERLCRFEGGYRQVELRVNHERALTQAVSFAAIRRVQGLMPTAEYLAHYATGISEHGLPEQYRRELLGIYSVNAG